MAELLEDVDRLAARVEAMPGAIDAAERRLAATASALDVAGDKYRMAVTQFTEQGKAELSEHLDRRAALTVEAQTVALENAVREALRQDVLKATPDGCPLLRAVLEHGLTAVLASGLTAAAVVFLLQRG